MLQFLRLVGLIVLIGTGQIVFAQCPATCTYTAPSGGTSFNFNSNESLCITGNVTNGLSINFNGSSNTICVASGVTWTQPNGGNFSGVIINVNGTFNMNGNYNFNNPVIINVRPGAVLNTNSTGFSSNLTINNEGSVNFTATGNISNQSGFTFNNLTTTATLSATATSLFKFGNGNTVQNAGIMVFSNLENEEAAAFVNTTTGRITVGRYFYNHGNFTNNGYVETICSSSIGGSSVCRFEVGDKGAGKAFTNASGGCFKVTGNVLFTGPGFNNSTMVITPGSSGGDLTLNNTLSGTNGVVIVESGTSTIGAAGSYRGTNMKFCDRNTSGGNFDSISFNSQSLNNYTVDCTVQACTGTAVAVACGPQLCPEVTLIRN